MLTVKEAQQQINLLSRNFGVEEVSLKESLGRVLAEDVLADRDYPPFNRSAMDGFALRKDDLNKFNKFKVVGEVHAGSVFEYEIPPGCCLKIMTGAPVPKQLDIVIRIEDTVEKGNNVSFIPADYKLFQNISQQGEDAKNKMLVLPRNNKITPAEISSFAVLGKTAVMAHKLPKIAVISTGNEVVAPEALVQSHQIRDSNSYAIEAFLQKYNISLFSRQLVKDDRMLLSAAIKSAMSADIIITSGGVSMGDADYLPSVFEELGIRRVFHKVAVKPGKPLWVGQANEKVVFGLPGNPVSVQVACKVFVEPFLRKCFGMEDQLILKLPLLVPKKKKTKFDEYFPCTIETADFSGLRPVAFNGSGDVMATLGSHGIAVHPANLEEINGGDILDFWFW